ncbi:hypothetical protein HBI01_051530 [Parastagonospora nodorum]|nr:hypothetical protein HBI01_051530 [Parastagonospora nodorum]KAH4527934.1 hypothetical protein HBH87_047810 [Parastagonospora nodorum]
MLDAGRIIKLLCIAGICSIVVIIFALGIRESCIESKSLISLKQCSTISYYLYLLLQVLGARY